MKQIMVTGDLHIGQSANYGIVQEGLSTKLAEQRALLQDFVDDAISRKVDLVVLGGDYFPKHIKLNPDAMKIFSEQILRLSQAQIPVRMVVGNHDKPRHEKMSNTIDYFGVFGVPNVEIIPSPKVELFNGVILYFFPHLIWSELYKFQRNEREGITEIVNRIVEEMIGEANALIQTNALPENTPRLFFGHFGLIEAGKGGESLMMTGNDICVPADVIDRPGISLSIMSHIHKFWVHKQAQHSKVVVIGSMDRFDFGEERDKKVYGRIEILDNNEFHLKVIPTRARKFVSIKGNINDSLDVSFLNSYDVQDAVIKVLLTTEKNFTKKKEAIEKIYKQLTDHDAYFVHSVGFVPQAIAVARNTTITEEKSLDDNVAEILKGLPDSEELLAKHKELFDEVKKELEEI